MKYIKKKGYAPSKQFVPYFSEHPDKYETYKNGLPIEVPDHVAEMLAHKEVTFKEYEEEIQVEEPEEDVEEYEHAELDEVEKENYKDKLMSVDGIGKVRAEEIMKDFPTEESLVSQLESESYDALKEVFSDTMLENILEEFIEE